MCFRRKDSIWAICISQNSACITISVVISTVVPTLCPGCALNATQPAGFSFTHFPGHGRHSMASWGRWSEKRENGAAYFSGSALHLACGMPHRWMAMQRTNNLDMEVDDGDGDGDVHDDDDDDADAIVLRHVKDKQVDILTT